MADAVAEVVNDRGKVRAILRFKCYAGISSFVKKR